MRTALALALLAVSGPALAGEPEHEREAAIAGALCAGMAREVELGPQLRADCVSESHAIEVDWADQWKYGLGQALAYAARAGLRPGLVLICRSDAADCLASGLGLRETAGAFGLDLTLWECAPEDAALEACARTETDR